MDIAFVGRRGTVENPRVPPMSSVSGDAMTDVAASLADALTAPMLAQGGSFELDGTPVDPDDLTGLFVAACAADADHETVEASVSAVCAGAFGEKPPAGLPFRQVLLERDRIAAGLPSVEEAVYTVGDDIVGGAEDYLNDPQAPNAVESLSARLGFALRVPALVIAVEGDKAKDALLTSATAAVKASGQAQGPAMTKMARYAKAARKSHGAFFTVVIRDKDHSGTADGCFARALPYGLVRACAKVTGALVVPSDVSQMVMPRLVCLVDLSRLRLLGVSGVSRELNALRRAVSRAPRVLTGGEIRDLAEAELIREADRDRAADALRQERDGKARRRSSERAFDKERPSDIALSKRVTRVMRHMSDVSMSKNVYQTEHATFARANRRHPDDYNRMGTSRITGYKPDIHLYLDTSGSISVEQYKGAVATAARLARDNDISLYVTFFSDTITEPRLLDVHGRSMRRVMADFDRLPKVGGGTDFAQVFNFIDRTPKARRELAVMLTDFEWYPSQELPVHPRNLWYAPVAGVDWDRVIESAGDYAKSMQGRGYDVRSRMLF